MNAMIPNTQHVEVILANAQSALRLATGETYAVVKVEIDNDGKVTWGAYTDGSGKYTEAPTLAGSISAQLHALIGPERIAAKREQAAKLLAEADAMAEKFAESRTYDKSPTINFHD